MNAKAFRLQFTAKVNTTEIEETFNANFNGDQNLNSSDQCALYQTAFSHFWLLTSYKATLQ